MSDLNVVMVHARRLELREHPTPPAGAEVHAGGVFHEVQRGDGVIAIAREYSQAYHMGISQRQLEQANVAALRDGLQPGERLVIPGLQQRFDSMFLARNPGLSRVGDELGMRSRRCCAARSGSGSATCSGERAARWRTPRCVASRRRRCSDATRVS